VHRLQRAGSLPRAPRHAARRLARRESHLFEFATGLSRRLTYSAAAEGAPAWADSGRLVAYTVVRGDSTDLMTLSPDGGAARRMVTLPARGMRLSNNGRRLAYTWGSWTRNRLVVANADGSRANALTDSASAWYNLAWSPGDSLIAATRSDSSGSFQIWLLRADGRGKRRLVKLGPEAGHPQWPAWSPDGRTIAFQTGTYVREAPEQSDAFVCTVDIATGRVTRLREHPHPMLDETPSWRDDSHIVFQSTQGGAFELWLMRADGSEAKRLTER
jgi:Tol biopolymer transport system component